MKNFLTLTEAQQIDTGYQPEWKSITVAETQAEFLQRMQRVVIQGKRLELTKPGMAFATLSNNTGSIVLVNQERPNGDELTQIGWEIKGGYGVQGKTGSDTANVEAQQETGRKVTTSHPLAMLRADHRHELHAITINSVELGDEDSAREVAFNVNEKHEMEWIRESRSFTPEQVQQLYLAGKLTDGRTLGILMAQELYSNQDEWNINLATTGIQTTIAQLQCETRGNIVRIAKMKSQSEIGYDDLLTSAPERIEQLLVRNNGNTLQFGLHRKKRHILLPSHTTPDVKNLGEEEVIKTIEGITLDEMESIELYTGANTSNYHRVDLRHRLVTNPANEQYGVRVEIVESEEADVWVDANQLAQLVQKGNVSLLTLAAIKAYLWETNSEF